jgi:probable F420-dependent oxidoreductase
MSKRVELGVAIPQTFPERAPDPVFVRRYLERAETLGFHSAWVVEHLIGTIPSLEPLELLTFAAAVTGRMRLGSAVLLTAARSPVHTAKSLATLDHLSGGRLDVGVGLGANGAAYPAFGLPSAKRAARFAEGLAVLLRLWTEPRVTFEGEFYRLKDVAIEPKPLQKPRPPLWFGAHAPAALRRMVEMGDGFMGAGTASTAKFAEQMDTVRRLLEEARRDPAAFPVGKRVYVAIDADRDRAAKRLEAWFGAFYGRPQLAREVSVWGPPDAVLEGLAAVVRAGAGLVMLNPVYDELDHLEVFASTLAGRL